ncbi:MAG: phage tail tape measure protein [Ruthenibacterium lactatiformans]
MAYDGHLKFDTSVDGKGFQQGISTLAKGAAAALTAVSAALGAMAGYAVKVGSDFEAGMSEVAAISGATGDELDALTAKAKEMGASTKFSATESAEALKYMAMAGWDTQSMLDGLPGIMNLAAASGEELGAVSDIVTDALTAFGLSASDAGHFADVLAKASSSSNTNVFMMGATFKYAAPLAGALGYSIEDCAQAIGLMANAGIKGEQAGTSFRAMLTRLASPTDDVAAAMSQLGISLTDAQGNMLPLSDVLGQLREGFAGLDEQQKAAMASTIAGQEAMSGLLAIVNAAPEDYEALAASIADADGAAQSMADTMQDNLQGQITILKSAVEGLGIEFYESIQEPLKDVVKTGIGYIGELSSAFKEGGLDGLVESLGSVFADAAARIVKSAPKLVSAAVSAIRSFVSGLHGNTGQILDAAIEMGASLLQGVAEIVPELGAFALDLIGQFAQRLIDGLPQMTQAGVDMLNSMAEGLATGLPEFLANALPMIGQLAAGIRESAGQLVDAGINLIMNLADGLIAAIPDLLANIPQIIIDLCGVINDNAPKLLMAGVQLIGKLVMGLLQAIPQILAAMPKIVEAIWSVISAFNWLDLGTNIMTFFRDGLKSMVSKIGEAGRSVFETVKNAIVNLPNTLKNLGSNAVSGMANAIRGLLSTVGNAAKAVFTNIVNAVLNLPSRLLELAKSAVTNVANAFKNVEWGSIGSNIITGIISGIGSAVSGLVSSAIDAAMSAFNAAKRALGIRSPSRLFADEIGKFIPPGITVGIEAAMPKAKRDVADDMEQFASTAQDAVLSSQNKTAARAAASGKLRTAAPQAPGGSNVTVQGETHVHVEVEGREIARAAAPFMGEQMEFEED